MTSGLGNAALLAVLAIVPLVVLMLTSFVKISVVLSLLRNAIGAPDAPSGLVVMGLSLLLTFFVMAPVAIDMVHAAAAVPAPSAPGSAGPVPGATPAAPPVPWVPPAVPAAPSPSVPATGTSAPAAPLVPPSVPAAASPSVPAAGTSAPAAPLVPPAVPAAASPSGTATGNSVRAAELQPLDLEGTIRGLVPAAYRPQVDAAARALGPLRGFLARHAGARDRETFTGLATRMGRAVSGDEIWILAPAFVTTELREAFAIAVLIFVPFLVLDLVVGLGLAALGLSSTSPQAIALPLKLLLFVAVDGWRLLIDSLLRGYA
jgi:type III secretion protein R